MYHIFLVFTTNSNKINVTKNVIEGNNCSNNTVEKQNRDYRKAQGQLYENQVTLFNLEHKTYSCLEPKCDCSRQKYLVA